MKDSKLQLYTSRWISKASSWTKDVIEKTSNFDHKLSEPLDYIIPIKEALVAARRGLNGKTWPQGASPPPECCITWHWHHHLPRVAGVIIIIIIVTIINIIVVGIVEIFAISDLMMTISNNAFVTNYFTIPIVLTSKISVLVWICLEKGDQPQNMIIIINQK